MNIKIKNSKLWGLTVISALCLSAPAMAQDSNLLSDLDLVPKVTDTNQMMVQEQISHPLIRLTPDKLQLVELDKEAVSVFVGNPDHLNVLLDTPKTLVLVPRIPGSTYFQVLDADGNTIYARHAIVASPEKNYVRIRKSCALGGETACEEYKVFFCPDMCHEVNVAQEVVAASDIPEDASSAGNQNAANGTDQQVHDNNIGQETTPQE